MTIESIRFNIEGIVQQSFANRKTVASVAVKVADTLTTKYKIIDPEALPVPDVSDDFEFFEVESLRIATQGRTATELEKIAYQYLGVAEAVRNRSAQIAADKKRLWEQRKEIWDELHPRVSFMRDHFGTGNAEKTAFAVAIDRIIQLQNATSK